jgi:uncharacterized protein YggE
MFRSEAAPAAAPVPVAPGEVATVATVTLTIALQSR